MTDDTGSGSGALARLGRIALGLGLALQASEDFRDLDDAIDYADSEGVPMPSVLAPLGSGTMACAGLGIALWRLPRLATGAAAACLTVVTLTMHDFWNDDPDDRSGDRLAFFGNLAMFGGVLMALREAWR
jgi:uncharacterized membrane protein YphA (DoxX/SURF4 family)